MNEQEQPFGDDEVADWALEQLADHFSPDLDDDRPEPATPDPEADGFDDAPTDDAPVDPGGADADADADDAGPGAHDADEPEPSGGADAVAGPADEPGPPAEIELALDGDDPSGPDPTDPGLGLALDPTGLPWPDPTDGVTGLPVLEHALDAVGGADLDALVQVAEHLGLADELDLGLDGHTTAVVLGELGLDALVDHGSLDDLAERLAAGDEVLLGAADGRTLVVVEVDDRAVVVEPVGGGDRRTLPVAALEDAWARCGYEMVVVEPGPTSPDQPIQLAGAVTLLPVSFDVEQQP